MSLDSIEELRQQQTEEMKEVENYVEHIRSLSNEREALTIEFETENEQLKTELEKLHMELEGKTSPRQNWKVRPAQDKTRETIT